MESPADRVCSLCYNFRPQNGGWWEYRNGVTTRSSDSEHGIRRLRESAQDCTTCEVLIKCVDRIIQPDPGAECRFYFEFAERFMRIRHNGPWSTNLQVVTSGRRRSIEIYRTNSEETPCPWKIFEAKNHLPMDTSSQGTMECAESMLSSCRSSHDACSSTRESFLPTRLLDVGGSESPFVKVQATASHAIEDSDYLALSHCWGKSPDITTQLTNESLNEYTTTGLAFELLPKTFQDAALVTRRLGKRYIWIDSLCIIQNDAHDWNREAATMCSVYEGALLTIAAASSASDQGGLFFKPTTYKVTGNTPDGPYTLFIRERIEHSQDTFPLLTRGWVLQERILSPRTLYFDWQELLWECRNQGACQCGQHGIATIINTETTSPGKSEYNTLIRHWHRLVTDFTNLELTYEKDTLPALAGVAARLAEIRRLREPSQPPTYLAGLWGDSLAMDLAWFRQDYGPFEGQRASRPLSYRAPSWSWASVNGGVAWDQDICDTLERNFHVLHTPLSSKDAIEPTSASHLTLRGMVVRITMRRANQPLNGCRTFFWDSHVRPKEETEIYFLRLYHNSDGVSGWFSLALNLVDAETQTYERLS